MKVLINVIVVVILILLSMIHIHFSGKPDNAYEQIAEKIIEAETGVSIDLSH